MCNTKPEDSVSIDVTITEVVLTPATCAALVNEIIKYLVYQKSQIPYPYNWLQTVVNRKSEKATASNVSVRQHHRVVSTAYNVLEDIMRNIRNEFERSEDVIQEVSLLFGATPHTLKEAFVVKIPRMATGHNELNHSHLVRRNQHKILRNIFLSEDWIGAMEHALPSTNMYVLLKKLGGSHCIQEDNFFLPLKHYSLPAKVRSIAVNLHYDFSGMYSCCNYLSVFEDSVQDQSTDEKSILSSSRETSHETRGPEASWYQARLLFKGYKDCFVNNMSASELF